KRMFKKTTRSNRNQVVIGHPSQQVEHLRGPDLRSVPVFHWMFSGNKWSISERSLHNKLLVEKRLASNGENHDC
ncbi:MAG: hypothetical protein WBD31_20870, partial [Rubripirellula sp.]